MQGFRSLGDGKTRKDTTHPLRASLKTKNTLNIKGTVLFGAEGHGRMRSMRQNLAGRYLLDISVEGRNKALELAKENNVSIDYRVGQQPDLGYGNEQFDILALIYAHFPPDIKSKYHHLPDIYLKRGPNRHF